MACQKEREVIAGLKRLRTSLPPPLLAPQQAGAECGRCSVGGCPRLLGPRIAVALAAGKWRCVPGERHGAICGTARRVELQQVSCHRVGPRLQGGSRLFALSVKGSAGRLQQVKLEEQVVGKLLPYDAGKRGEAFG
jgi:hypothetical protein